MQCLLAITDRDVMGTDEMSNAPRREAVRAILMDADGLVALLYVGKYDVYTIPGGGVEEGESLEDALVREVMEETGCESRIMRALGYVDENRGGENFTQRSYGYLAEVSGKKGMPQMTEEEIEEDTQVRWHPIGEATRLIEGFHAYHSRAEFWRRRELAFLRAAGDCLIQAEQD